jgi:hypothetical protein
MIAFANTTNKAGRSKNEQPIGMLSHNCLVFIELHHSICHLPTISKKVLSLQKLQSN